MIQSSSTELMTETDWNFFKSALPGNIKFLEGLLENGQDNENIISSLVKAYTGYAYGVHETLYLQDKILEKENSIHKENAILFYQRALEYGFRWLELKGLPWDTIQMNINNTKNLASLIKSHFGDDDLETLFFLGNAFGSLANLQQDNMRVVSSVPVIKALYDRVCKAKPDFQGGSCQMFYGIYELSRPRMLGGNPKKGKQHFLDGMKKYPGNYLIRVNYLRYSVMPAYDKKEFNKQAKILDKARAKFESDRRKFSWGKKQKRSPIGLYNAIAFKQFLILEKYRKKIFE